MPVWGIVKTAAHRCRGQLDALLPEAERLRAMVHQACLFRQKTMK